MLKQAGCRFGDLEELVAREGLEGALQILFVNGIYLTVDEFKGRRPVVRGSAAIYVDPARLRNPLGTPQVLARTSGSRSSHQPGYGLKDKKKRAGWPRLWGG